MNIEAKNRESVYKMKLCKDGHKLIARCDKKKDLEGVLFVCLLDKSFSFDAHNLSSSARTNKMIGTIRNTLRFLIREAFIFH